MMNTSDTCLINSGKLFFILKYNIYIHSSVEMAFMEIQFTENIIKNS